MRKQKQYWRSVNPIPLSINLSAGESKVPPHVFVMTRNGMIHDRLPFTNWVEGCCNKDMQVVAFCYMIKWLDGENQHK